MNLFVQGTAAGSAQLGGEALPVAGDEIKGWQVVFPQAVTPVERPDEHHSGAECPAHLLFAFPKASREASGHPHEARVEIAQDVPAHGEHDRLRSVIALPQQITGLRSYIFPHNHVSSQSILHHYQ